MSKDAKYFWTLVGLSFGLSALAWAGLAQAESDQVYAFLMRSTPHYTDKAETMEERGVRMRRLSAAMHSATTKSDELAFLLMKGERESRWARYVDLDEDRCRKGEDGKCDGGKAWSPWQIWGTDRKGGSEYAAKKALSIFRKGARYCKARGYDYYEGGVAMYAKGGTCSWSVARARVKRMWVIHWQITRKPKTTKSTDN